MALERKVDVLLWHLFPYWLIIDTINGYFVNIGAPLPISQVFKLFVTVSLITAVFRKQTQLQVLILSILYILIFLCGVAFTDSGIAETIVHLSKFILLILLFTYFRSYNSQYPDLFMIKAMKVFKIGFIILILNLILGLLGFGFHTYAMQELGNKGFFYAGNEVGGLVCTIYPVFLFYIYNRYRKFIYILASLFLLMLSISFATKSVILASLLIVIAIPFIYARPINKVLILLGISATVSIIISKINIDFESALIDKFKWIYETGGLIQLIFSGRNEFLSEQLRIFSTSHVWYKLFGIGGNISVEMDPFDFLFNYGYIGVLIFLYVILRMFKLININKKTNRYCKVLIFQNILLIMMSIIAGHIIFSGMASLYIALTNSLLFVDDKRIIDQITI